MTNTDTRERTSDPRAASTSDAETNDAPASYYGVWLCEHLSHLGEHLPELVQPAAQVAQIRRRPWWR